MIRRRMMQSRSCATMIAGVLGAALVSACSDSGGSDTSQAGGNQGGQGVGGGQGGGGKGNQAPVVDAGADQTIALPLESASFTATATDSDGTVVSYAWTQVSGPQATLSNDVTPSVSVHATEAGKYVFRATAVDDDGASGTDDVTLTVQACATCKTYVVDTTGDDTTGDGSAAKPWRTLFKATSSVTSPGDTIHVNAGTYVETAVSVLAPGISIEGDGDTSVIKCTVEDDWTAIIEGASAEGVMGNQHLANFKLDGQALSSFWAIRFAGRSNVTIHDVTVVDFKDRGVLIDGRADNVDGPPGTYASGIAFYKNTIHNSAAYDTENGVYGRGALNVGGTDGMVIHDNVITQTERPDGYNGWPIKYDLGGHNKGMKIYDNVLTKIPFAGDFGGDAGWDFAIELWNVEGGLEIYGNTVQGSFDFVRTHKNGYPFGAWIHDNVISQPTLNDKYETGILFEKGVEGGLVEHNTVDRCSSGLEVFAEYFGGDDVPYNPIIDLTIRNNRFTNIGRALGDGNNGYGIQIVGGFGADGVTPAEIEMKDVFVYNNTIVAAPGNAPYFGIGLSPNESTGTISNVRVANNIVQGFAAAWLVSGPRTASWDGLQIHNNLLFQNGGGDSIFDGFVPPSGYVESGNLTGQAPMLDAMFRPLQGSPAIDAGIDVGIPFQGAAPDLGYYEN